MRLGTEPRGLNKVEGSLLEFYFGPVDDSYANEVIGLLHATGDRNIYPSNTGGKRILEFRFQCVYFGSKRIKPFPH